MKGKDKILVIALVFVFLGTIYLVAKWISTSLEGEIEIIVVRIYVEDSKHVGVEDLSGNIHIFQKGDAEPLHAGGIYWIRFKGRRILAFEKIGELGGGVIG